MLEAKEYRLYVIIDELWLESWNGEYEFSLKKTRKIKCIFLKYKSTGGIGQPTLFEELGNIIIA